MMGGGGGGGGHGVCLQGKISSLMIVFENYCKEFTANERQSWTDSHDYYFECLIIHFDYLIIQFDYSIIG